MKLTINSDNGVVETKNLLGEEYSGSLLVLFCADGLIQREFVVAQSAISTSDHILTWP